MTSKLASFLTQDGRVTARRMADAFQRQVIFGGSLDTILLEMALVDAEALGEILSRANDLPFCDAEPDATAKEAATRSFNSLVVERFHAVPIARAGGKLRVMLIDPADAEDIADLAEALGEPVEPVIGFEYRQQQAIEKLYGTALPKRFVTLANKLAERSKAGVDRPAVAAVVATASPARPSLFTGRVVPAKPPSLTGMSPPAAAISPAAKPGEPHVAKPPAPVFTPASAPIVAAPAPIFAAPTAVSPTPIVAAPAPIVASPVVTSPVVASPVVTSPVVTSPVVASPPVAAAPATATAPDPIATAPAAAVKAPAPVPTVPTAAPAAPVKAPAPRAPAPVFSPRPLIAPVRVGPPAAAERLARSFHDTPVKATTDEPRPSTATPPLATAQVAAAGGASIEAGGTRRSGFHDTWPFQQPAFNGEPVSGGLPTFKIGPAALTAMPLPELTPSLRSALDGTPSFAPTEPSLVGAAPLVEEAPPAFDLPVLSLGEGIVALQAATARDGVFESLCRIARARFSFAAIFAVQGDGASARMALGPAFFDPSALAGASVDLREASPLRTAVQSRSPFIGRLAEDEPLGRTLSFLGRRLPAPGALLPIVMRERVVAVIVADNDAKPIVPDDLGELIQATAEAGKAFLRIIQAAKKGGHRTPAAVAAVPGRATDGAAAQSVPVVSDIVSAANPVPIGLAELERLLGIVEREEPDAASAAARYLTGGDDAARLLATRFPGPLRFGHRKLHTIALSPVEHGPLVALAPRMGERIVPLLFARLDDPSPDARFHAALVLGELRSDAAAALLGQRLFDPDVAVRRAAGWALSRFAPSDAFASVLERIREVLESGDLARERAAAFALGELRDVISVPKLIDKLTHRDMEVVEIAQRALVVICKQDFGTARWRWRSWWEKAKSETRADWLLAGLEQTSTEAQRSAAEELAAITSDRFGCHARLSRREREDAARRFAAWHRMHPGIFGDDRRTQN